MTPALALLVTVLAQTAGVTVGGTSQCPTPEQVAARLHELAPPHEGSAFQAIVNPEGAGVSIELLDAAGAMLGHKVLGAEECDVLADASAVFLATWMKQLHGSELAAPLAMATQGQAPSRWWEIGAAVIGGLPDGAFGVGGSLEAVFGMGAHWGASLALVLPPQGVLPFDVGSVAFRQPAARLGAFGRMTWNQVFADLRAEMVAGVLMLEGRGFDENRSATAFVPGAGASLRLGADFGRLRPFLAAVGTVWLPREAAKVTGVEGYRTIPQLQLLFAAGCAWSL